MGPLVTALIQKYSPDSDSEMFENFVWQETITAENSHWQDLKNSSKLVHLYGTMHKRVLTENRNYICIPDVWNRPTHGHATNWCI